MATEEEADDDGQTDEQLKIDRANRSKSWYLQMFYDGVLLLDAEGNCWKVSVAPVRENDVIPDEDHPYK